jgi:3-deoxy-D-manno-octulosonic-acid transferase
MIAARLYRLATWTLGPIAGLVLARRAERGKEEPARLGERWGRSSLVRPAGRLIWLHAASVGESLSLLPIIERLPARLPAVEILVTTGTVTSARLLAERLASPRTRHQYLPLDHPAAIRRFLDHWRPDLALWVESELWPNLLLDTHRRGIPMALLNARISAGSFRGWQRTPRLIRALLGCFDLVLAQDEVQADRLTQLGARDAGTVGDLKAAADPLSAPAEELARLRALIAGRPVWLAASTHEGEELAVAEAHRRLRQRFPTLLTLLAPRHPARAAAIASMLAADGMRVTRRSSGLLLAPDTEIHLIDTLGELGLFYRLAPIVLVAGSLGVPGTIGGHNPLEAAQLGCAVIFGSDTANCTASSDALERAGAARRLADSAALNDVVAELMGDPAAVERMGEAGRAVAEASRAVIDRALARLEPLLAPLAAPQSARRHARA